MPLYKVISKADQTEATRYSAGQVLPEYGDLADFDHVEFDPEVAEEAPQSREFTQVEWLKRFTQAERIAIYTAASGNAVLDDFIRMMNAAPIINTGDPDTILGVNTLEYVGLLSQGRAQEILNG